MGEENVAACNAYAAALECGFTDFTLLYDEEYCAEYLEMPCDISEYFDCLLEGYVCTDGIFSPRHGLLRTLLLLITARSPEREPIPRRTVTILNRTRDVNSADRTPPWSHPAAILTVPTDPADPADPALPERTALDDAPPLLGSWRNIYAVVIGNLIATVALLWWLTRVYS